MQKKYVVRLTPEERAELEAMVKKGKAAAYKIKHARILPAADAAGPAWSDRQIAEAFSCHPRSVENVRRRLVLDGLATALERKKRVRPSHPRKLDGKGEARLIALACSPPPEGRDHWTLKLLADTLVKLEVVDSICDRTVRRTLEKTNGGRTCRRVGGFRPRPMRSLSRVWRTCWTCTNSRTIRGVRF